MGSNPQTKPHVYGVKVYQAVDKGEAERVVKLLRDNGYSCIEYDDHTYDCYIEVDHARYRYVLVVT